MLTLSFARVDRLTRPRRSRGGHAAHCDGAPFYLSRNEGKWMVKVLDALRRFQSVARRSHSAHTNGLALSSTEENLVHSHSHAFCFEHHSLGSHSIGDWKLSASPRNRRGVFKLICFCVSHWSSFVYLYSGIVEIKACIKAEFESVSISTSCE